MGRVQAQESVGCGEQRCAGDRVQRWRFVEVLEACVVAVRVPDGRARVVRLNCLGLVEQVLVEKSPLEVEHHGGRASCAGSQCQLALTPGPELRAATSSWRQLSLIVTNQFSLILGAGAGTSGTGWGSSWTCHMPFTVRSLKPAKLANRASASRASLPSWVRARIGWPVLAGRRPGRLSCAGTRPADPAGRAR